MKYLTALSEKISVGHLPESTPLAEAFSDRHKWKKLLTETTALVVLVCFESSDVVEDLKEAAGSIETIFLSYKNEVHTICLVPFGHLSFTALHDNEKAEIFLYKLQRILTNKGLKANCVPVGQGNIFMSQFLFFDKLSSTKLRSSRNSLKETIDSLVRIYGFRKIATIIANLLPSNKQP